MQKAPSMLAITHIHVVQSRSQLGKIRPVREYQ